MPRLVDLIYHVYHVGKTAPCMPRRARLYLSRGEENGAVHSRIGRAVSPPIHTLLALGNEEEGREAHSWLDVQKESQMVGP